MGIQEASRDEQPVKLFKTIQADTKLSGSFIGEDGILVFAGEELVYA